MLLLGVDPHKSTHTATAVDPASNQQAGSLRIDANLADYRRLLTWGRRWPQRKGVVENANGLGRHLAQWLVARSETVVDVPASATSRVRQLTRGGGRKNDRIDAAAAATAHIHGDGCEVNADDHTTALALLDERRVNLAQARVRTVNQLHAVLRDLLPGGAPPQLSADQAAMLLRTVRPAGDVEKIRRDLAGDLVTEIRALDKRLAENAVRMEELVESSGSTLMNTPGVGPVLAARLVGRVGRASRFATAVDYPAACGEGGGEGEQLVRGAGEGVGRVSHEVG
ncbi:transposase [Streptomyces europaeiscabiei]|nr:transposase [Streptomyces europaeiscabiei]MDX3697598.1 transposase [Streptomyces europaeiscabiei]